MTTIAALRRHSDNLAQRWLRTGAGGDHARTDPSSYHQSQPATATLNNNLDHQAKLLSGPAHHRPARRPPRTLARTFPVSQIPIAPAALSVPNTRGFVLWRLSDAGRRWMPHGLHSPASETLHNCGLMRRSNSASISITSSARANSIGGISRPSALGRLELDIALGCGGEDFELLSHGRSSRLHVGDHGLNPTRQSYSPATSTAKPATSSSERAVRASTSAGKLFAGGLYHQVAPERSDDSKSRAAGTNCRARYRELPKPCRQYRLQTRSRTSLRLAA